MRDNIDTHTHTDESITLPLSLGAVASIRRGVRKRTAKKGSHSAKGAISGFRGSEWVGGATPNDGDNRVSLPLPSSTSTILEGGGVTF